MLRLLPCLKLWAMQPFCCNLASLTTAHTLVTARPQENPNAIPEGETPHAVSMFAFDSLLDVCKPGDRITVTGIYKAVPMRTSPRLRQLKVLQSLEPHVLITLCCLCCSPVHLLVCLQSCVT